MRKGESTAMVGQKLSLSNWKYSFENRDRVIASTFFNVWSAEVAVYSMTDISQRLAKVGTVHLIIFESGFEANFMLILCVWGW